MLPCRTEGGGGFTCNCSFCRSVSCEKVVSSTLHLEVLGEWRDWSPAQLAVGEVQRGQVGEASENLCGEGGEKITLQREVLEGGQGQGGKGGQPGQGAASSLPHLLCASTSLEREGRPAREEGRREAREQFDRSREVKRVRPAWRR